MRRLGIAGTLIAGLAVTAALAPASQAARMTLGSDLSAPANANVQQPVDTALWNLIFAHTNYSSTSPVDAAMPSDGQILTVRVKGIAQPSATAGAPPPLTQIHFQDLQPQSDGSVVVIATSQPFDLPSSGDPNQVSSYAPTNLCVRKGDYLSFNDEGGFDPNYYPNGVAFQVLSSVQNSTTDRFSQHNGTGNGARFTGMPMPNEELLMQWDLASGPDASPLCGGTMGVQNQNPNSNPNTQGQDTVFGSLPPPTFAQDVDVAVVSGKVFYKPPATATSSHAGARAQIARKVTKGRGFLPLTRPRQIPVGSVLDTSRGTLALASATPTGALQAGDFAAGLFRVFQRRNQVGLTELDLTGGKSRATACAAVGKKASAAKLSKHVLRLLRSSVQGNFQTRGRYSAATVRGTQWQMADRCDGTFTQVTRGTVVVTDLRRHKQNIVVSAGQSYLARAVGKVRSAAAR